MGSMGCDDDCLGMPQVPPGFPPAAKFILEHEIDAPKDRAGIPHVPPGFPPYTKFILQPTDCEASTSGSVHRCSGISRSKRQKVLLKKPWLHSSLLDRNSEKEAEQLKGLPSAPCLPKGVIRGCPECGDCQKVVARWKPDGASQLSLVDAPVFHPSQEEFEDPLKYIENIRVLAEPYGMCRVVPPPSWKPPCLLKEKKAWTSSKFSTVIQPVHKLQKRENEKTDAGKFICNGNKRQKVVNNEVESETQYGNAEEFAFATGPSFTLASFQKFADEFKQQYFQNSENVISHLHQKLQEPSVESLEGEYWRIIEHPTDEIEVLYGADLDTSSFGSGFPRPSSDLTNSELDNQYSKSGWNLNNFPRLPRSLLCFESGDTPGVIVPWVYVGMCFSSFCWHVEDHNLYSVNYLHFGAPKVWYAVPGKDFFKFEAAMKKQLPNLFEEQPDLLQNLVTQLSPSLLTKEGIPVFRCVQNEGEFIITFPRAYHSGFSCGFNCAEAVNIAPVDWIAYGQTAVELYRLQKRKIALSHDKLLLEAANAVVRAHWNVKFARTNTTDDSWWIDVSGTGTSLRRALEERFILEESLRHYLSSPLRSEKMDDEFYASNRECDICHSDLHLSAVICRLCLDKYACLFHSEQLCQCSLNNRKFLFRYEISELNILLEAFSGKLSAVHRWGLQFLGLTLNSASTKKKGKESSGVNGAAKGTNTLGRESYSNGRRNIYRGNDVTEGNKITICAGTSPGDKDIFSPVMMSLNVSNESPSPDAQTVINCSSGSMATRSSIPNTSLIPPLTDTPSKAVNRKESGKLANSAPYFGIQKEMKQSDIPVLLKTDDVCSVKHSGKSVDSPDGGCALPNGNGPNSWEVELLDCGKIMPKEGWSSKSAIYPLGYRSRVSYINFLDPQKTSPYICEILEACQKPLYTVQLEDDSSEEFVSFSVTKCWKSVQERVNTEIARQNESRKSGEGGPTGLPLLQPHGSIDGHKMFGLSSPRIIEVIEALDPDHLCSEYWKNKTDQQA